MVKAMLLVSVLVLGLTWSLSVQADHHEQHGTAEPAAHVDDHNDHHNDTHDMDHKDFNRTEVCNEPPLKGPIMCLGYFERYFHNSTSNQCEMFIYGGCRPTRNHFKSMADCVHACHPEDEDHADHTDQDAHGTAAPAHSDGHNDTAH